MELWIRSQDKTDLFKINRLKIREHSFENGEEEYFILNNNSLSDVVGIYKTKERALEVLDEIQNILKPKYILDSSSIKPDGDSWVENGMILQKYNANAKVEELSTYVYEMPKE